MTEFNGKIWTEISAKRQSLRRPASSWVNVVHNLVFRAVELVIADYESRKNGLFLSDANGGNYHRLIFP